MICQVRAITERYNKLKIALLKMEVLLCDKISYNPTSRLNPMGIPSGGSTNGIDGEIQFN